MQSLTQEYDVGILNHCLQVLQYVLAIPLWETLVFFSFHFIFVYMKTTFH